MKTILNTYGLYHKWQGTDLSLELILMPRQ